MTAQNKSLRKFFDIFSLDLRSLALFRILVGFCLVYDLSQKLIYSRTLYSDWGIFPRTYWIEQFMSDWKISFMLASGEAWFQAAFIGLALLCAIAFTAGYKTRWAQIICWILLGSIQSRNNQILSCADDLLRMALFWSVFVPCARFYSLDSLQMSKPQKMSVVSWGTAALILQLFMVYFFTALYKIHPVWIQEFSAIYYALNLDLMTTSIGRWLKDFVVLSQIMTATTLVWEFIGPFLLFIPVYTSKIRFWVALIFIGFHFGLYLTFDIGTFPWIAMAYWTIFFPAEFWQKAEPYLDQFFAKIRALNLNRWLKPSNKEFSYGRFQIALTIFFLLVVTWYNTANLKKGLLPLPSSVKQLVFITNMNQAWDMFAPYPIRNDGWFVIEGNFKDGETKDLLTGKEPTSQKPKAVSDLFPVSELRKLYMNLWDQGDRRILLPYGRYVCRAYTSAAGAALSTAKITFYKETTPPLGEPFPEVVPIVLWQHDCFAN